MAAYILLMHSDTTGAEDGEAWGPYLARLRAEGVFQGGSSMGGGEAVRKLGAPSAIATHLVGFIRVEARDLVHVQTMPVGNPTYEAGGTVEIRELPRDN